MGFTKFDSGVTDSSLWDEHSDVLKVFEAFWTKSDPDGIVNATYNSMYRTANLCGKDKKPLPISDFDYALNILLSPDPNSRTKTHDGRRIIRLEESKWLIVTYKERREYTYSSNPESVRKREYRNKNKEELWDMSQSVPGHSASTSASESISLSSNNLQDKNEESKSEEKNWKNDFQTYQAEELTAYNSLKGNLSWIEERQKYHSGLNILLTLEKAHVDYWSTKEAWKHKKAKKSKSINWVTTFNNALTQKMNQVWKKRDTGMAGLFDEHN